MNPRAFDEFAARIRKSGMPGAEVVIALTAIATGYRLVPREDGELQAARS